MAVAKLQRGSSKVPAWQQQGSSVAVAKLQRGSSKVPAWQQQGSSTGFLTLFAIERYPISWYSGFPIIVPSKKGEVLEVDIHGRGDAWQLKNTSPNGNSPDFCGEN